MAPLSKPHHFCLAWPARLIIVYSMSEETHDAAIRGPVAIRAAILVSGVTGWMLTVTFCFCMSDYDGIMATPTGLPVAQIFFNAGGKTGGTIMWFFVMLVQFFTGCSAMLANARMAWAFARDDAFPFSGYVTFYYTALSAPHFHTTSCIHRS